MKYLLDTNILVFLLRNKFDINDYIVRKGINNCLISEITIAELTYGAFCSNNPVENLKNVSNLKRLFKILPIYDSIDTYGEIKSSLRKRGMPIDDFDLLIAATAIHNDIILVTDNVKHFDRIPVKLENWIKRN